MTDPVSNYRGDVRIDVKHFDLEWLRQADLVYQYGIDLAAARSEVDRTEEAMKIEEALAAKRVRDRGEKLTVDAIKQEVILDEKYTTHRENHLKACEEFNIMKAVFEAIVMKKATMENYLKGQLAGLWGEPVVYPNKEDRKETSVERCRNAGKQFKKKEE